MNQVDRFLGRHAIITGGSSGIGLALARLLVKNGANLCIIGRDSKKLQDSVVFLEQYKHNPNQFITSLQMDVSDWDQVNTKLKDYLSQSPSVDFLFNSAGVVHPGKFEDLDISKFAWMIHINYLGTVYPTKVVIPNMIEKRSGHIINISSVAGYMGVYGYTAYSASKFAVRGFSDALRSEMRLHNINLSIVFPPDTQTPQLEYETPYKPAITKALAGNKVLSAEYVANFILKKVAQGKYIITPGFESTLYFYLQGWLGELNYPLMDYLVKKAHEKVTTH